MTFDLNNLQWWRRCHDINTLRMFVTYLSKCHKWFRVTLWYRVQVLLAITETARKKQFMLRSNKNLLLKYLLFDTHECIPKSVMSDVYFPLCCCTKYWNLSNLYSRRFDTRWSILYDQNNMSHFRNPIAITHILGGLCCELKAPLLLMLLNSSLI